MLHSTSPLFSRARSVTHDTNRSLSLSSMVPLSGGGGGRKEVKVVLRKSERKGREGAGNEAK